MQSDGMRERLLALQAERREVALLLGGGLLPLEGMLAHVGADYVILDGRHTARGRKVKTTKRFDVAIASIAYVQEGQVKA